MAQILETAKRLQKIAPQHGRASPVMSVTGSLVNDRDKDSVSIASVRSGSRHVTPSLLTARAPTGRTKFVRYNFCHNFFLFSYNYDYLLLNCRITYMVRIEMTNIEIRELQMELEKLEQSSKKKKIYLRARMEENHINIRETCKTREEFEQNVVQKGADSITGKIPAEKFIRCYH
ncbi:uncharacterized protein LOC114254287 [Monomorium pharaonis]|uniref:uncharacterized protein LOC114254287 n=1 Tax=Monomorium pharaonis TaxID=307658 RepID=UPI00102E1857|nr:uncharacterized protein LOC114254287 [Monomorium pharaonis]